MAGPLTGFRVLDFGQYIAGPMLGMLLADQGADVIKVERPGGDPFRRHPAFGVYNRGKRSLELDLKTEGGRRAARALASDADILIENFRPGVADQLGIGYEEMRQLNPQLVYSSLPGFASESGLSHLPAWEPIIGATTAFYARNRWSTEPVFSQIPLASTYAAMLGATSTAVALFARDRFGLGQKVEVPLHSATFVAIGYRLSRINGKPSSAATRGVSPMVTQYRCRDGRYVMFHSALEHFTKAFLEVTGKTSWETEGLMDRETWEKDPARQAELAKRMEALFLERDALEWENVLSEVGVPCAVCRSIDEWMAHPHTSESGMVITVDDPVYGPMQQLGIQARLRNAVPEAPGPAPRLNEHGEAIQQAIVGLDPKSPAPSGQVPQAMGTALAGIGVLDLCLILAGPTCGRVLAEFGADVIKIDPPDRRPSPDFFLDTSRGKRSMVLDLKSSEGLEIYRRLAESADVVVENFREGVAERLGIGYDQLRKIRPDIIVSSINCYGYQGPWARRPGWEQIAQAAAGVQVRQGGRDGVPTLMPFAVNDYGTGMMGAYPVVLALLYRNRTGRGQRTETGLAFTSMALQSAMAINYQGFVRQDIEGPKARGLSALSRLYRASDEDWLYMHCAFPGHWDALAGISEFQGIAKDLRFSTAVGRKDNDLELSLALAEVFSSKPLGHWLQCLEAAGIPVVRNNTLFELPDLEPVRAAGLCLTTETPGKGTVDHLGIAAKLSLTPAVSGCPTPVFGSDAEAILSGLGYDENTIAKLQEAGITRSRLPDLQ